MTKRCRRPHLGHLEGGAGAAVFGTPIHAGGHAVQAGTRCRVLLLLLLLLVAHVVAQQLRRQLAAGVERREQRRGVLRRGAVGT